MTKYINEETHLRLWIEKPDHADKKYWINRFYNIQEYEKDLAAYQSALASQPTFLKIGDGWEKYGFGDTVDGGEVEIVKQFLGHGNKWTGMEFFPGSFYESLLPENKRVVARLKHKEAGEESLFNFRYRSCGKDLQVNVKAHNLNAAMMFFAKHYNKVDAVYGIENITQL